MTSENRRVQKLFEKLCSQPRYAFPEIRGSFTVSNEHGVYIIRKGETVLHVGRTLRGKGGLHQRLQNHLGGASSFTNKYLLGNGGLLRNKNYTYQYIMLKDPRKRVLLEAYATGVLCPKHIGLGR